MKSYAPIRPLLHHAVLRAPSGIGAMTIADLLGWKYPTMMSELSGQPGHKLGADRILPLMKLTGSDEPLHFLANEMGGVFLRPHVLDESEPAAQARRLGLAAIKEFGELVAVMTEAIMDGTVTSEEREKIAAQGQEAVAAIMGLLRMV